MGVLLEDRSLEMVLRERLWSDFRGRITLGLADLRGEVFGAGSPLAPCCCPRPWATASSRGLAPVGGGVMGRVHAYPEAVVN